METKTIKIKATIIHNIIDTIIAYKYYYRVYAGFDKWYK